MRSRFLTSVDLAQHVALQIKFCSATSDTDLMDICFPQVLQERQVQQQIYNNNNKLDSILAPYQCIFTCNLLHLHHLLIMYQEMVRCHNCSVIITAHMQSLREKLKPYLLSPTHLNEVGILICGTIFGCNFPFQMTGVGRRLR